MANTPFTKRTFENNHLWTIVPTDYWTHGLLDGTLGQLNSRTPLIFPGGVCFFDCRRAGRHLHLQAAGILSFADSDATAVSPWRPFHNFLPFWTPHSRPPGVLFPLPSLFGRHTSIPLASDSQHQAILDATSASQWRPFHNFPRFWTPHPISPGVHLATLHNSGRHL